MMIKEFDFKSVHAVRKQCWGYKTDGNTPIKRGKNLYPLEVLTKCDELRGFFVEVTCQNSYGDCSYIIWNDLGNSCVKYGNFHPAFNLEEIELIKENLLPYNGVKGFRNKLALLKDRGEWIRNTEIMALADNWNVEEATMYQEYHDKLKVEREEKERWQRAEFAQREREREQKRQEEITAQLDQIAQNIRDKKDFKNDLIDGKSIVLCLMDRYGIKVPIKTQGWFNQKLAWIIWIDGKIAYRYRKSKGTNGSQTAFKYLDMLEDAVNME